MREIELKVGATGTELWPVARRSSVIVNAFEIACKPTRVVQYRVNIDEQPRTRDRDTGAPGTAMDAAGAGGPVPAAPAPDARKPRLPDENYDIVRKLSEIAGWAPGWIFNGQDTLYSIQRLSGNNDSGDATQPVFQEVTVGGRGTGTRQKTYLVCVTEVKHVSMQPTNVGALKKQVQQTNRLVESDVREAMMVLDVVLKHAAWSCPGTAALGRNMFNYVQRETVERLRAGRGRGRGGRGGSLRDRLRAESKEVNKGAALRIYMGTDRLNMVANAVPALQFRSENLAEMMSGLGVDMRRPAAPGSEDFKAVQSELKGLSVVNVDHPGRTYRVRALHARNAHYEFACQRADGTEVTTTVAEHMASLRGGRQLRYPDFNLVDVSPSKRRAETRPILLPLEVLQIKPGTLFAAGTRYVEQMKEIMGLKPAEKKDQIATVLRTLLSRDMRALLDPWLSLPTIDARGDGFFREIPAMRLEPPMLQYAADHMEDAQGNPIVNPESIAVQAGAGSWNAGSSCFLRPGQLDGFAILNMTRSGYPSSEVVQLVSGFIHKFRTVGSTGLAVERLGLASDVVVEHRHGAGDLQRSVVKCVDCAKRAGMPVSENFVLFVAIDARAFEYGQVKALCEGTDTTLRCGLAHIKTQCFVPEKAHRGRDMYALNLAFKLNLKLGGVNFQLWDSLFPGLPANRSYMFVGLDVSHPERGGQNQFEQPSIGCICASVDECGGQYRAVPVVMAGEHKGTEMLVNVKAAFATLLAAFVEQQGELPETIIVFRDGVAEGDYANTINREVLPMKEAFREAQKLQGMNPDDPQHSDVGRMTVVVCRKRNQVRFFPGKQHRHSGRNGNVDPGTVVSTAVTSPFRFNFFLVSHEGIQGTARPVEYVCIHDEVNFGLEGLTLLTYWLCYTYNRCTRSVSVPPPVFYAHQTCTRVRAIYEALQGFEKEAYVQSLQQCETVYTKVMLF